MALIDQAAAPTEQPAPDVAETAAPPSENKDAAGPATSDALSPEKVDASIKLPPELQSAYKRVVIAGMKVMFDPKTHQLAMEQMKGDGPIAQRLGTAIAGLMLILFKQSNNTMPPQVLIPAGTSLLVRAADFLQKGGAEQITTKDIGGALEVMITTLLSKAGMDPEKVMNSGGAAPEQGTPPAGLVDQAAGPAPADAAAPAQQE